MAVSILSLSELKGALSFLGIALAIIYFHLCSWLLALPIGGYILDAYYRTYLQAR